MTAPSPDANRAAVFISVPELHRLLEQNAPLVVLEVFLPPETAAPAGAPRRLIPGAVRVNFPAEAAGAGGGTRGRLPLPEIADLQGHARRWGIRPHSIVVTYGDRGPASRVWWLLRWGDFRDVRILDGGLPAWVAAGHATASAPATPAPGNVELSAGHLPVLDADAAAALARKGVLLDARGPAAYAGEASRATDARSGHIPGAHNVPTDHNLDKEGRLLDPVRLQARFAPLGVTRGRKDVGVYCGGGVAACHEIAVLESLGVEAALFPDSWSAWNADPARPVATGSQPG